MGGLGVGGVFGLPVEFLGVEVGHDPAEIGEAALLIGLAGLADLLGDSGALLFEGPGLLLDPLGALGEGFLFGVTLDHVLERDLLGFAADVDLDLFDRLAVVG